MEQHLNYIHYNPVKHGHVDAVRNWEWSSFHRYVRMGYYDIAWGSDGNNNTNKCGEQISDLVRCQNYIHYNPEKHGHVGAVRNWEWSSFYRYVLMGYYDIAWGSDGNNNTNKCGEQDFGFGALPTHPTFAPIPMAFLLL